MSLFFVDSCSELSADLTKKMGVERINLPYKIDNELLEFSNKFDFERFYSRLKKGVNLENISLTQEKYCEIFEPCLKQGDDIIYAHASSSIFDLTNLLSARQSLLEKYSDRKFELIDTKNISIGQGLVSYNSAMLYRKGETIETIIEKSNSIVNEFATFFLVDSVEKLVKNNIVSVDNITGTALNIKSVFAVDLDGKIQLYDKVSGKKSAVAKLIEICRQVGNNVADYPIGIAYSSDIKIAEDLENKLKETFGNDINLIKERISPSNASILGNFALALSFHVHRKIN